MPLFHFDLVGPDGVERDLLGIEFNDLDAAYLGAMKAVIGITGDLVEDRKDARHYRFEVRDPRGALLLELPFAEALRFRTAPIPLAQFIARERLQQSLSRNRELKAEVKQGLVRARTAVETAQATLRRSRSRASPFS